MQEPIEETIQSSKLDGGITENLSSPSLGVARYFDLLGYLIAGVSLILVSSLFAGSAPRWLAKDTPSVFESSFWSHKFVGPSWVPFSQTTQGYLKTSYETFAQHDGPISAVAMKSDGSLIATGGEDGSLRLWDGVTGEEISSIPGHSEAINSLVFWESSNLIVSGSSDGKANVWEISTGDFVAGFGGTHGAIGAIAVHEGTDLIATGHQDGSVILWDMAISGEFSEAYGTGAPVSAVTISEDGSTLFVGHSDGKVKAWNLSGGKGDATALLSPAVLFADHNSQVTETSFRSGADGELLLLTGSMDGTAKLINLATIGEQDTITADLGLPLAGVAFAGRDRTIVIGTTSGIIRRVSLLEAPDVWQSLGLALEIPFSSVSDFAQDDDNSKLVVVGNSNRPLVYEWQSSLTFVPPFWAVLSFVLGAFFLSFASWRALTRIRSYLSDQIVELVFVADTPLSDPALAGERLSKFCSNIAAFLRNPNTGMPFTIAITGNWGKGKSSALKLIERELVEDNNPVVWFNAWHHQKEEHLFASLIEEVGRKALPGPSSPSFYKPAHLKTRLRLAWLRIQAQSIRFTALAFLISFGIVLSWNVWGHNEELAEVGTRFRFDDPLELLGGAGVFGFILFGLIRLKSIATPFQTTATALLAEGKGLFGLRRFTDRLSFRDRFSQSFDEFTKALGDKRLTIIIDDLDRCNVDQVSEIMEAINYLTSSGRCFILLGIHEGPVRHALGINRAELARAHAISRLKGDDAKALADPADEAAMQDERNNYADLYLEKLLNLRVAVPDFGDEAMVNFLNHRVTKMPVQNNDETPVFWTTRLVRLLGLRKLKNASSILAGVLVLTAFTLGIWGANKESVIADVQRRLSQAFPEEQECLPLTETEVWRAQGHEGQVGSVAVSPDGKYVITADENGTARLWQTEQDCWSEMKTATAAANSLSSEPDVVPEGEVGTGSGTSGDVAIEQNVIDFAGEDSSNGALGEAEVGGVPKESGGGWIEYFEERGYMFLLLLLLWPLGNLSGVWLQKRRQKEFDRATREGREDSALFKSEVERGFWVIHQPDDELGPPSIEMAELTPRVLMRFLNLSRFLVSGLDPQEERSQLIARIRLFALETALQKDLRSLDFREIEGCLDGNPPTPPNSVAFFDDRYFKLKIDDLEDYKRLRNSVSF